eukprot:CAMPEP_0180614232 /NCGR_PEP_ID=MMETSP1037_2-20121125/31309_1 /TAXON_ID=632150 /ORGANISM="Azadinium spinosum, Strain 3D9" /LENGTH=160 /DNA_ID=CAMNT_0022633935 /DNA_START=54 /DNA_END=533 /DNA_ORIENTATION=-
MLVLQLQLQPMTAGAALHHSRTSAFAISGRRAAVQEGNAKAMPQQPLPPRGSLQDERRMDDRKGKGKGRRHGLDHDLGWSQGYGYGGGSSSSGAPWGASGGSTGRGRASGAFGVFAGESVPPLPPLPRFAASRPEVFGSGGGAAPLSGTAGPAWSGGTGA